MLHEAESAAQRFFPRMCGIVQTALENNFHSCYIKKKPYSIADSGYDWELKL